MLVHRQCCTVTGVVYTGLPEDNPFIVFRDMSRHLSVFITAREPPAPAVCKQTFTIRRIEDSIRKRFAATLNANYSGYFCPVVVILGDPTSVTTFKLRAHYSQVRKI